jgi:anti-sigma factor RsiW
VNGDRYSEERVRELLMGALDGELTQEARAELERLLASEPLLQEEWKRLSRVKEVTESMKLRKPPEETWDGYWNSVYSRLERSIAWILVSIAAIVLISYGGWHGVQDLLADAELPWYIKGSVLAGIVGLAMLLVSVVRHRIFVSRSDPYKDIQR